MFKYCLKRILHMIPIIFGVVLLTFILFNVVGGSPAAVVLGKNATCAALDDFDEQRGFNKPLVFGRWCGTRAFPDLDFRQGPGLFGDVPEASHVSGPSGSGNDGWLELQGNLELPAACPLRAGTGYRIIIECELPEGSSMSFIPAGAGEGRG